MKLNKHKESRSRRNRAFSKEQIETIKKIVEKKNPQLWLFIQFIYFCFLRPNEIRQLEHRYFDMGERTILVPGSISKNGKDGYVSIPDGFYEQLKQSDYFKTGNKANTKRAIRSVSSRYSAIKRCILRKEESTLTSASKPAASFSKQTV